MNHIDNYARPCASGSASSAGSIDRTGSERRRRDGPASRSTSPGPSPAARSAGSHSSSTPARDLVQRSTIVLLDVGRDGLVRLELHRERALAAGHALEVGGVAEDLAERDGGLDRPGGRRASVSMPVMWPRRVERSAEMSPNFSIGHGDLEVDDRLQQDRPRPRGTPCGRPSADGGLERLLRAVDRRGSRRRRPRPRRRRPGCPRSTPFSSCSRTPFSTAGMNWLGITPPLTASTKLNPSPRARGRTRSWTSANWPRPPVCFLWRWCASAVAGDRLQVGDVRDVGVDVELVAVLEPVLDHVEVQLAHPRDDQLVRLGVAAEGEGRVLVGDLGQADGDLRLVLAGLRLDGAGDHRGRELDRVELEVRRLAVAGGGHGVGDVQVVELGDRRRCRRRSPP